MAIGVGLAGFGLAGRVFHTPLAAASGLAIRAVASSRADEVRAKVPGADVVGSFEDLLGRSDVELVIVATPNVLHAAQARAALEAGKHVAIDKPATPTAAETRALDALAKSKGLVASVFQNRRWDADMLTLEAVLAAGEVGGPVRYRSVWNRHRAEARTAWRETPGPAAGVTYDLGAHLIDQALVLFGKPDWIQADVFRQRPPPPGAAEGADDGFEILMGKGWLKISLASSSLAAGPSREIRLDGDRASFLKIGLDVQEERLRAGADPRAPGFGDEPEGQWGALWGPAGEARAVPSRPGRWTKFYDGVRRAIETGGRPPVELAQAAETIAVIEAAFESARTGGRIDL
jgi:scyllo-inositol 2-dehydrogenase (NADP+)